MQWQSEPVERDGQRHRLLVDGQPLSWRQLATRLAEDEATRTALGERLAQSPHPAVWWETPASTDETADRPFEMVVLPARGLARARVSWDAFAEHLGSEGPSVRTFPNLGNNAQLVVPMPLPDGRPYGHLAAFVRTAPAEQADLLWRRVGEEVLRWWATETRPVWVSTAGGGVPWLHVRLDRRPKYYKHGPYRTPPG